MTRSNPTPRSTPRSRRGIGRRLPGPDAAARDDAPGDDALRDDAPPTGAPRDAPTVPPHPRPHAADVSTERAPRTPAQARGERRVAALLDAAAEVIAEVGFTAASVHEIARRAGGSVGALYHFFGSKDALVAALTAQYVDVLRGITEGLRQRPAAEWAGMPVADVVRTLLEPYATFFAAHPAYVALAASVPGGRMPADPDFEARGYLLLLEILAARWPRTPARQRDRVARTVYAMADGVLVEVARAGGTEGQALFAEFAAAITAYFHAYDEAYEARR